MQVASERRDDQSVISRRELRHYVGGTVESHPRRSVTSNPRIYPNHDGSERERGTAGGDEVVLQDDHCDETGCSKSSRFVSARPTMRSSAASLSGPDRSVWADMRVGDFSRALAIQSPRELRRRRRAHRQLLRVAKRRSRTGWGSLRAEVTSRAERLGLGRGERPLPAPARPVWGHASAAEARRW